MFDAIARALRSPQSSAERRHRSPLAEARDPIARADRPRARARSVHRHRRSRDRGADARGRRRRAWSASISPARCCASAREKLRARASTAAIALVQRRRDAHSARRRVGGRRDDRVRHPQRRESAGGVRRDAPRAQAGRPARDPRVRDSRPRRLFERSTCGTSATCCRASAAPFRGTTRAYGYLPASVGAFASPDEFVKILRRKAGFRDISPTR